VSELASSGGDVQQVQAALQLFEQGREQIGRVIAGQQELIEQALLTLL
jgi:MoxR-like ATPase